MPGILKRENQEERRAGEEEGGGEEGEEGEEAMERSEMVKHRSRASEKGDADMDAIPGGKEEEEEDGEGRRECVGVDGTSNCSPNRGE